MNARKYLILIAVVLLALTLAACGGSTDSGNASSSGSINLSQTFSADDSAISFKYPEGWVVTSEFGQVSFANSQAAKDSTEPTAGAFVGSFLVAPTADITGLVENPGPADVLNLFKGLMEGENAPVLGDVSELKVGSFDAATVSGSDDTLDAIIYVVKVADDAYVVAVGGSIKGEMGNFEPTLKAILETMTYAAPAAG
ncbi:MAG: hypothetical protein H6672_03515 [Anaerolineaceae bacterium]|nr:hypothetical protein [Anaerolineaceae bacterium]